MVGPGRLLDPITRTRAPSTRTTRLFDDYAGVVFDVEEGKRIAHALGGHKAVILRNHGLLTVGGSVEEAAWWFITMERSCHAQLLAVGGRPDRPHRPRAGRGHGIPGRQPPGRPGNFAPLLELIVHEQPDLLD